MTQYSRTPLIRINWDGQPYGYAENPDNLILLDFRLSPCTEYSKLSLG